MQEIEIRKHCLLKWLNKTEKLYSQDTTIVVTFPLINKHGLFLLFWRHTVGKKIFKVLVKSVLCTNNF
jgi:hypothetical protein